MSRPSSTSSIEPLETSFAGQSSPNCGTPYSRDLWNDETAVDDWIFEIECVPGQIIQFHGEELEAPDFSTVEEKLTAALRRVCHFMVDRIDRRGLQEVCQSLAEFYEYYRPTEPANRLLPATHTRSAAVNPQSVSSAFIIGEE